MNLKHVSKPGTRASSLQLVEGTACKVVVRVKMQTSVTSAVPSYLEIVSAWNFKASFTSIEFYRRRASSCAS